MSLGIQPWHAAEHLIVHGIDRRMKGKEGGARTSLRIIFVGRGSLCKLDPALP
jgi:hypothetical protein